MIKLIEVEFPDFSYTTKAYNYGEFQGTLNDGDNVTKAITEHLKPFLPEVLHTSFHFDNRLLDYRFNAWATKVIVGNATFYYVASDVRWNEQQQDTTFNIVSSDEDTYLKERQLMLESIEQINRWVAKENAKKQEKIQAEESLKHLEKSAETQNSYKVYYQEDGKTIDLLRTSRDAMKYHNLI